MNCTDLKQKKIEKLKAKTKHIKISSLTQEQKKLCDQYIKIMNLKAQILISNDLNLLFPPEILYQMEMELLNKMEEVF